MILSILVPAMPHRPYCELVDELESQADGKPVEVLCVCDERMSGPKRQELTERSTGRYVAFVDDDDRVSPRYVDSLLEASDSLADVLTFNLNFHINGRHRETWRFGPWENRRHLGRMCLNHLCAWRREIATRVAWCPSLGHNDDHLWFEPLFRAGFVRTTHHVDDSLYQYLYRANATVNQSARIRRQSAEYMRGGKRCWMVDGEILIEHEGGMCRDRCNELHPIPNREPYHLVYPITTKKEVSQL